MAERSVSNDPLRIALVAGIALGCAWILHGLIASLFGLDLAYLLYLIAIEAAALFAGPVAGLLTFGIVFAWSAVTRPETVLIHTPTPMTALALFTGAALTLLVMGAWGHRMHVRSSKAVETLRQSEQRLSVAMAAANMGTWEWTITSDKVVWSPELERIHGRKNGSFKGTFDDAISDVHPDDRDRLTTTVRQAVEQRGDFQIEYRIITGEGRERWMEARGKTLCDRRGQPERMTGICMDVTERRNAQRRLADVTRHFKVLTETVPDFVWSCAPDGRIEYLNPQYASFTGLNMENVNERWQSIVHPDDAWKVAGAWARSLQSGEPFEMAYRFRGASDGQYRWFLIRTVPVRDENGQLVRWVGSATDLHEAKMAAEERGRLLAAERKAREQAEHAGRIKDRFLATLSHELRTPLTPVLLTTSLLETHPQLPADAREDVKTIRRNVELEARLIDDLLDLTRISRGKFKYDFQMVDLHLLIRGAMGICCRDGKLTVDSNLAARAHHVNGDAARLQQVFWNLLNNAWKFTPPGGKVWVRTRDVAGGRIRVEVEDTGNGIDPKMLPRVFDAFEQCEPVRARKSGGLGLGLAISRALVTAHHGTISAQSDGVGKGSKFTVELPTVAARTPEDQPKTAPSNPAAPQTLKVLLVEDHPTTLKVITKLLRQRGHQVVGAATVAEGLKAAREGRYDLLISDLGLPDGTGYELMRQVRGMYALRGIALSGYGMEEDIVRSRQAGFEDHLVKPIDLHTLEAAISRIATGAAHPEGAPPP